MNRNALKAELTNDPLAIGYDAMSLQEAADSLNAETRTRPQPIASTELLAWSGEAGRLQRIENAGNDTSKSDELRSVAKAAYTMILRDNTVLDLSLPNRAAMLTALVDADVLTVTNQESLEALATVPISRATELGLGRVRTGDVDRVRNPRPKTIRE